MHQMLDLCATPAEYPLGVEDHHTPKNTLKRYNSQLRRDSSRLFTLQCEEGVTIFDLSEGAQCMSQHRKPVFLSLTCTSVFHQESQELSRLGKCAAPT